MATGLPYNEAERLASLREHGILDTDPEQEFDDLVRIAAQICAAPIAAVSLVDADRQWFKSILGVEIAETTRDISFCAHTILQPGLMIVPDACADARFADNPLVTGDPHIRFYAGMPLISEDGYALGSLCVIDTTPRSISPEQEAALRVLARLAASQIKASQRAAERERLLARQERLMAERERAEEALRRSADQLRERETFLQAVLESAPVVLYALDTEGTVTLSEGAGLDALGLKPGEAVGQSAYGYSEGDPLSHANTRRALAGESLAYDARFGNLRLHTELRPMRDAESVVTGVIGVCFDVTERVASEERFRVLFEYSSDPHLLLDESGIIDCNDAALHILRCADKARILSLHSAVMSPEFQPDGRRSQEKCLEMVALARANGFHRFEWTHRKMDGEEFPVEATLTPVMLQDRSVMVAVWHDLTERKKQEEQIKDHAVVLEFQKAQLEVANAYLEKANAQLEDLANTDGLTGLRNHRVFQERLAEEVARAVRYDTPLSIVFLDVDRFKEYNDDFGHPEGDAALREVGRILLDSARDTDIAARYGGEEFVLALPQTDLEGAAAFAERLRVSVENHPWLRRAVTASFGVAGLRLGAEGSGDLVKRADAALYRSKSAGRNCVICDDWKPFAPELALGNRGI